jgi:hypothetical protein
MNSTAARKLAKYATFTTLTLYEMLVEALASQPDEYWLKPNSVNELFDNGAFFNRCRIWLGYVKGVNDNKIPPHAVVVKVLECAGEFSKVQLPKRKPRVPQEIICTEKPTL